MTELEKLYQATEQKDMAYLLLTYGSLANAAARIVELDGNEVVDYGECERCDLPFTSPPLQYGAGYVCPPCAKAIIELGE